MKNIRLIVKLIGGFSIVALIVVAVGFFGLWGAGRLTSSVTEIGSNQMPALEKVLLVEIGMRMADGGENGLMNTDLDDQGRQATYAQIEEGKKSADEAIKDFEALAKT